LSPEAITHVILTHHDHDHVGAAAALKQEYPNVRILASAEEAPYVSGSKKSLRLEQAERLQKELPEEQQAFGAAFCDLLRSVEPVQVDRVLQEDERLPFCGGCQVLATPGHTPGHISLYLKEFDTILSGDAMALEQGQPVLPNPQFTLDLQRAKDSMQRLLSNPAQSIIFYHGGLFKKLY
jgi:glyoxylase-like metal-dependent hydrolase (beta-lactamase superfamily II)